MHCASIRVWHSVSELLQGREKALAIKSTNTKSAHFLFASEKRPQNKRRAKNRCKPRAQVFRARLISRQADAPSVQRGHAVWLRRLARAHVAAGARAVCAGDAQDAARERVFACSGAVAPTVALCRAGARGRGDCGVHGDVDGAAECDGGGAGAQPAERVGGGDCVALHCCCKCLNR